MQKQIPGFLNDKLFLPEESVPDIKFECRIILEWSFAKNASHSLYLELIPGFVWEERLSRRSEFPVICVGILIAKLYLNDL
jgi:hypothetical protein